MTKLGLAAVAVMLATSHSPASAKRPVLRVVFERAVPLTVATDVRWLDDEHALVADAYRGIARIGITSRDASVAWLQEWPASSGPGTGYFHLALSPTAIVAADFAFGMRWRDRKEGVTRDLAMEYVADVDVQGNRLLVAGLRRDDSGRLGADGAFAWSGSLDKPDPELRPLMPFGNRAAIENCAGFGIGAVRILADGSQVVVPGAERNIYRYGRDGRLAQVWKTDDLGVEINCDFTRDEQTLYGTDPVARQQRLNRRAMIDEIVDTPDGPAVLLRQVTGDRTAWTLALLTTRGVSRRNLGVSAPSPWAHVAAAARGRDLLLLIADRLPNRPDGAPPRLIRLRWSTD